MHLAVRATRAHNSQSILSSIRFTGALNVGSTIGQGVQNFGNLLGNSVLGTFTYCKNFWQIMH